jgi:hypothetical protein
MMIGDSRRLAAAGRGKEGCQSEEDWTIIIQFILQQVEIRELDWTLLMDCGWSCNALSIGGVQIGRSFVLELRRSVWRRSGSCGAERSGLSFWTYPHKIHPEVRDPYRYLILPYR